MIASENAKILIVDDDVDSLNVLLEMLSSKGYSTFVSNNGADAVEKNQMLLPDLILLDVMMPGANGFETCRRIKQNNSSKDVPIIFITALSETANKVKGFEAGGVDYIIKPYQVEEVLSRVNTHLTLKKQKQELEKMNADKDKFFSILAVDLRSPIAAFFSYIRLLDNYEDLNKNDIKKLASDLGDSAKNIYNLLDNLLDWSLIQRGLIEFSPGPVSIKNSVNNNIILFMPHASKKGVLLVNLIKQELSAYCDCNLLDTILRNLITNAIKFTRSGGKVEISAGISGDQIQIQVTDSGVGIPEIALTKLFRIDSKYQKPGTAGESGTGLGLIISKDLVEINKGEIWIRSEEEKGTTVTFSLPKAS